MLYLILKNNTNDVNAVIQFFVYGIGIFFFILFARFIATRKVKVFLLDFRNDSIKFQILGWLMKEPDIDDKVLTMKGNFIGKKYTVALTTKYYEAKVEFFVGIKKFIVLIGTFLKREEERFVNITLTREQYNAVGQSKNVMEELNKIVDDRINQEITKFKNVSLAMVEVTREMNVMSEQVIDHTRTMLQGNKDWMFIAQKMYNLDRDEINVQLGEELLKNKFINEIKSKAIEDEKKRSEDANKKSLLQKIGIKKGDEHE